MDDEARVGEDALQVFLVSQSLSFPLGLLFSPIQDVVQDERAGNAGNLRARHAPRLRLGDARAEEARRVVGFFVETRRRRVSEARRPPSPAVIDIFLSLRLLSLDLGAASSDACRSRRDMDIFCP